MNRAVLPETLPAAHDRIAALESENLFLKEKLELVQRKLYGRSSERRFSEASSAQLNLFAANGEPEQEESKKETISYERSKPSKRERPEREGFPEHLERVIVELKGEEPEEEHTTEWVKISEHLCCRPTQFYVKQYQRPVYKTKSGEIIATPAPEAVFSRVMVDRTTIAWIIVAKFCWHLPLNRIEQMLKSQGINLSRDTMINYVLRTAELVLPVYKSLVEVILESQRLLADETPVIVGKRDSQGHKEYRKAYFWPVMSEREIAFFYSPGRATKNLQSILKDYRGHVQCDGYCAYTKAARENPELVLAGCWAHARRKFVDAEKSAPETVQKALKYIKLLYRVERYARQRNFSPPELRYRRCRWSAKLLKHFKEYLQQVMARPEVLPKSLLCKACSYTLTRWTELTEYTANPQLSIDSNEIERQIRPVTLGRKNWLFCSSEVGAEASALFYSLINTCKLNGVDPWLYLTDLLLRVSTVKSKDIRDLLPKRWSELFAAEAKANFL